MKKTSIGLAMTLVVSMMWACDTTDSQEEAALQGQWDCVHVVRGAEESDGEGIQFTFEGEAYTYQSGGYTEEGNFWVENGKLFTEGPQVMKKQVTLERLTSDSLVLGMNDRGTTMTMTFLKE